MESSSAQPRETSRIGSAARMGNRRRSLLLALGTIALVALSATVGSLFGLSWGSGGEARLDVEISRLTVSLGPEGGRDDLSPLLWLEAPPKIRVVMKVKNNTGVGQLVDAWWFLAEPGDRQPWLGYRFQSRTREEIFLEPESTTELVWEEELAVPAGEYQLSGWVHTERQEAREHADGVFLERKLTVLTIDPPYLRRDAPSDLEIEAVDDGAFFEDFPTRAPLQVSLPVSIRNRTGRDLIADVSWDLVYESEVDPFRATPGLRGGVLANQKFAAGSNDVITFEREISPRPGAYLLLVRVAARPSQEGVWDDAKLFTTRLEVTANSAGDGVARIGEPSGPISISRVRVSEPEVASRSPLSVRVEVSSSSQEPEDIEAWWFLSSPGTNDPWAYNDFLSQKVATRIEPGAVLQVEISDSVQVVPGDYELSVWVHVVSGDRDDPSDGAWWARQLRVR